MNDVDSLSYSARPRVVLKYLSQAGVVLAGLQLPPAAVAFIHGDYAIGAIELAIGAVLAAVYLRLKRLPVPERMLPAEALVVVSLAFVFAALLLWLPLAAGGLSAIDAFFEAVSAVTTTGLSTLATIEDLPSSLLFLRSWGQWYGGLGILVFVIALLTNDPAMATRLVDSGDRLDTTMRRYARKVSITYFVLTAGAFALLFSVGATPMAAAVHALSGISTGGFSTFDASVAGFADPLIWYAVAFVSLCGAVSLPLYSELGRGRWRTAITDEELRALLLMIAATWLLLTWSLWSSSGNALEAGRNGALLAVFAQTTTGYSTVDVAALAPFAKLVLIMSMVIGGSMGSTAGGVKLLRFLLFLRLAQLTIRRLRVPAHAVLDLRLAGRLYDDSELLRALFYVLLFAGVCLLSWLAFLAAGYAPIDSLLEVVSAAGTVGLSTGVTDADLATPLKLVLAFDMMAGRLEIVALLILVHPGLWLGRRLESL